VNNEKARKLLSDEDEKKWRKLIDMYKDKKSYRDEG
jgi:hypothetical protein